MSNTTNLVRHRNARTLRILPAAGLQLPDRARRAVSIRSEHEKGEVSQLEPGGRPRLLYIDTGLLSVTAARHVHPVSSCRALWVAPGITCRLRCKSDLTLYTLELDVAERADRGPDCRLVHVTELLRALVPELANADRHGTERSHLVIRLLLDEVRRSPRSRRPVTLPDNERLAAACQYVADNLMRDVDLDELAAMACMSRRTFTRVFRRQTGVSFGVWRQHLRLLEAFALLEDGTPVSQAAYNVGYSSISAFSSAFRNTFGILPGRYSKSAGAATA